MIQSISAMVDVVGTCQSTVGAPVNCYRPIVIEVLPVMLYTDNSYHTVFYNMLYTGSVHPLPVSVFAQNCFLEARI